MIQFTTVFLQKQGSILPDVTVHSVHSNALRGIVEVCTVTAGLQRVLYSQNRIVLYSETCQNNEIRIFFCTITEIRHLIDGGKYFAVNRARQYGKATMLMALNRLLQTDYYVIFMGFQTFSAAEFETENAFSVSFANTFLELLEYSSSTFSEKLILAMNTFKQNAADFDVDMSFSQTDILGMLEEYEADHHTGMNLSEMAALFFDYTAGYPELNQILYTLLFTGKSITYNYYEPSMSIATMFGFIKNHNGILTAANRIFDTWLYKGYLISFNFNQKKEVGVHEIVIGNKTIVEAVC